MNPRYLLACSLCFSLPLLGGLPQRGASYESAVEWARPIAKKWSYRLRLKMPTTGNAFLVTSTQALTPQAWSAVLIHETRVAFIQTYVLDPMNQLALLHLAEPDASPEALMGEIIYAHDDFTLERISRGSPPLTLLVMGPHGNSSDPGIEQFLNSISRTPIPFAPEVVRHPILDGSNIRFEDRWGRTPCFTFDTIGLVEDPQLHAKWGGPETIASRLIDQLYAKWSLDQTSDHYRQILATIHVLQIQGPAWFKVAVDEGWSGLAQELLNRGLDPRQPGPDGTVPMVSACALKDGALFDDMLRRWGSPIASFHPDAGTWDSPLLAAVRSGLPSRIRQLLSLGADPNQAIVGITPLEAAIQMNSLPMVQVLLQANAKITTTALDFAKVNGSAEILAALNGTRSTELSARP